MGIKVISKRLLLLLTSLFVVFGLLKTIYNYYSSVELEKEFVKRQTQSLNYFMLVHREYYQKLYIDKIIPLNEETVIGLPAYSSRFISKKFSEHNSFNITVSTVSERARNSKNLADSYELKAIKKFKENPNLKEYLAKEDNLYQYATPLYIEKKCLKCHGAKEDAPTFISSRYDKAYNYKVGELRGIISVKVPLEAIHQYFLSQFLKSFFYDLIVILLVILTTFYLIKYFKSLNIQLKSEVDKRTSQLKENVAFFESYKIAIDESSIVSKSDLDGKITYINDNFVNITGYSREEIIGSNNNIVRHPDTPDAFFDDVYKTLEQKKSWKGIFKNRTKYGKTFWVDTVITPILNASGDIVEYIAVRHDITELILQRKALEKSAYTDSLTGLLNRPKLQETLQSLENPFMALFDIDNFSKTNDFYGSKIGDLLIIEMSNILRNMTRGEKNIHIFRLNGDEFVILATKKSEQDFIENITLILNAIHASNIVINQNDIPLDVTVGISFEEPSSLLATADIALKHAKRTKKQLFSYNESLSIEKSYEKNMFWSKELKKAIKNDKLVPYFQPIVNNHTGKIEKYEALIRLIDDNDKVISPFFFLEVAKQSKQYSYITKTVIDKSFQVFKDLDCSFSINLTLEDILNVQLQKYLFDVLSRHNIGSRVVFEIVESEGIENFGEVNEFIINVKKFGCKIAIDDFGTGYSNFEYIMNLNADYIKIDGSMIKNLDTDRHSRVIVSTIVVFAKKIGMQTIAEFVKDEHIQEIVVELGVDYSQGYYFGEPRPQPLSGE
jgi:diguanylate cyclase (GGDEF)-like protein/PAS domain S-box-containing protein